MKIIYYAPDETMGDTSEEDRIAYRAWAKRAIEAEYPGAEVVVHNGSRGPIGGHDVLDAGDREEQVREFLAGLRDSRPWDRVD